MKKLPHARRPAGAAGTASTDYQPAGPTTGAEAVLMRSLAVVLVLACLALPQAGCGGKKSATAPPPAPNCEGYVPGNVAPPAGSRFASLPTGASINLSTGAVDPSGTAGDLRYLTPDMIGMAAAPSGVSWWTGNSLSDFTGWIASTDYLPPAQGWNAASGTAGSAGKYTRWLKIAGGRYAMVFSVAVTDCAFEFFYVAPYGSYTWSDTEKPTAPTIQSVTPGSTAGTLDVQWLASSSVDVEGYWVGYGTEPNNWTRKYAGAALSYVLTGLESGRQYYVWVLAYDPEGNMSDNSAAVTGQPN
jgi:hypothetical protein